MIRPGEGPPIKKPNKQEEKLTLDHDLAMDKPILARKKKSRGQKTIDLEAEDNANEINFQKKVSIVPPPSDLEERKSSVVSTSSKKYSAEFKSNEPERPSFPQKNESNNQTKNNTSNEINRNSSIKPVLPDIFGNPLGSSKKTKNKIFEEEGDDSFPKSEKFEKLDSSGQLSSLPKLPKTEDSSKKKHSEEAFDPLPSNNFGGSLSKPLPSISDDKEKKKKNKKKGIFNDDDDEEEEKKQNIKPVSTKNERSSNLPDRPSNINAAVDRKSNLPDFKGPGIVPKPGERESKKLKKLFDDDEDEDGGSLFKPQGGGRRLFG